VEVGQLERRIARAQAKFAAREGRSPGDEELAEEAGVPVSDLARVRGLARTVTSLDKPVGEEADSAAFGELLPSEEMGPSEEVVINLSQAALRRTVAGLPQTERRVIELRFGLDGEPVSLRSAARELGISASEVERVERQALARLSMERELQALGEAA
jgi:RNA polymerase primary sigma factor